MPCWAGFGQWRNPALLPPMWCCWRVQRRKRWTLGLRKWAGNGSCGMVAWNDGTMPARVPDPCAFECVFRTVTRQTHLINQIWSFHFLETAHFIWWRNHFGALFGDLRVPYHMYTQVLRCLTKTDFTVQRCTLLYTCHNCQRLHTREGGQKRTSSTCCTLEVRKGSYPWYIWAHGLCRARAQQKVPRQQISVFRWIQNLCSVWSSYPSCWNECYITIGGYGEPETRSAFCKMHGLAITCSCLYSFLWF